MAEHQRVRDENQQLRQMPDSICRHARASLPPDALNQTSPTLQAGAQRQSLLAAVGQGERRPETEQYRNITISSGS